MNFVFQIITNVTFNQSHGQHKLVLNSNAG